MSKLAELLAAQKAKESGNAPTVEATSVPAAASETPAEPNTAASDSSHDPAPDSTAVDRKPGGLAFLAAQKPAQSVPESPKPAAPVQAGPAVSKGLAFLGAVKAAAPDAAPAASESKPVPAPAPTPAKPGGFTTLAELEDSESPGGSAGFVSRFADQIDATAPIRELPADLSEQAKSWLAQMDSIYSILHEPEMLGNVVRNIMEELAAHPEYRQLIHPKDSNTIVRAMRDAMGLARIKKEESKSKRRGSGKVKIESVEALALMDEMFGNAE
jgi:hypothetical protein